LKERFKALFWSGDRRFCTVCKNSVRSFRPYGHVKRTDAKCPVCGALERHRFTWAFFKHRTDLFSGAPKRVLHIGPEPAFESRLRALPYLDYVTADQQDVSADVAMDITAIQFAENEFDVIHCSHVLEHVQEDLKAMRELSRVLRPGGWATILVPVIAEQTFDDPSVTCPKQRAKLFGQWDHVRAYGKDFADRLTSQGFHVDTVLAKDLFSSEVERERAQFKDEQLFFCRKATSGVVVE
jgi:SAM-dependent methyltransferase